jgi:hypothetical protein
MNGGTCDVFSLLFIFCLIVMFKLYLHYDGIASLYNVT